MNQTEQFLELIYNSSKLADDTSILYKGDLNYLYDLNFDDNQSLFRHRSSMKPGGSFNGGYSYTEISHLMKAGETPEDYEFSHEIQEYLKNIKNQNLNFKFSESGDMVDVGRALTDPDCFQDFIIQAGDKFQGGNIVQLNVSVSFAAVVSSKDINQRGLKIFKIAEKLISIGKSVEINIVIPTKAGEKISYAIFNIKSPDEVLNENLIYFWLTNPNVLRRIYFRFYELMPKSFQNNHFDNTDSGYGAVFAVDQEKLPTYLNTPKSIFIDDLDLMEFKYTKIEIAEYIMRIFEKAIGITEC